MPASGSQESASSWYRGSAAMAQSLHAGRSAPRAWPAPLAAGPDEGADESDAADSEGDLCCVVGTPGSSPSLPELKVSAEPVAAAHRRQAPAPAGATGAALCTLVESEPVDDYPQPPQQPRRAHRHGGVSRKHRSQASMQSVKRYACPASGYLFFAHYEHSTGQPVSLDSLIRILPEWYVVFPMSGCRRGCFDATLLPLRVAVGRPPSSGGGSLTRPCSPPPRSRICFPGQDDMIADMLRASQRHMERSRQQEEDARRVASAFNSHDQQAGGSESAAGSDAGPTVPRVITIPTSVPFLAHGAPAPEDDRPLSRCKNRYQPTFPPLH